VAARTYQQLEDELRQPEGIVIDGAIHIAELRSMEFRGGVIRRSDVAAIRCTVSGDLEGVCVDQADSGILSDQRVCRRQISHDATVSVNPFYRGDEVNCDIQTKAVIGLEPTGGGVCGVNSGNRKLVGREWHPTSENKK
jgi:hypothetical protein